MKEIIKSYGINESEFDLTLEKEIVTLAHC